MSRDVLSSENIHPAALTAMSQFHRNILEEVKAAVQRDAVVVVGMTVNPAVKKARQALDAAGVSHTYLEYGGYLSMWRSRLAIKLWSGWPTFPQVYVHGVLVGGGSDLKKLIDSGEFKTMYQAGRRA